MVTTPNLFGPGYSLATLTEAINIIPNLWGRLQEYNLFPAEGITTRDIAIDLVNEYAVHRITALQPVSTASIWASR